jgi:hypothetical protein
MENNLFEAIEIQTIYDPADYDNTTINKEEHLIYGNDSVEQENIKNETYCEACNKKFTTKSSLKRHHERSQVCKKWISLEKPNPFKFDISIIDLIEDIKYKIVMRNVTTENGNMIYCNYCNVKYSNVGNLNKHYKTAITCNMLAYNQFHKEINKILKI